MKSILVILSLIHSFSVQAQSGKLQTSQCGNTLREVSQIINQQFKDLEPGEITACFRGNWGYGLVIDLDKSLNLGGFTFEACPQASGAVYLRKKGTQEGGMLVCQSGAMRASGFSGDLVMANGIWTKQGSVVATGARPTRWLS